MAETYMSLDNIPQPFKAELDDNGKFTNFDTAQDALNNLIEHVLGGEYGPHWETDARFAEAVEMFRGYPEMYNRTEDNSGGDLASRFAMMPDGAYIVACVEDAEIAAILQNNDGQDLPARPDFEPADYSSGDDAVKGIFECDKFDYIDSEQHSAKDIRIDDEVVGRYYILEDGYRVEKIDRDEATGSEHIKSFAFKGSGRLAEMESAIVVYNKDGKPEKRVLESEKTDYTANGVIVERTSYNLKDVQNAVYAKEIIVYSRNNTWERTERYSRLDGDSAKPLSAAEGIQIRVEKADGSIDIVKQKEYNADDKAFVLEINGDKTGIREAPGYSEAEAAMIPNIKDHADRISGELSTKLGVSAELTRNGDEYKLECKNPNGDDFEISFRSAPVTFDALDKNPDLLRSVSLDYASVQLKIGQENVSASDAEKFIPNDYLSETLTALNAGDPAGLSEMLEHALHSAISNGAVYESDLNKGISKDNHIYCKSFDIEGRPHQLEWFADGVSFKAEAHYDKQGRMQIDSVSVGDSFRCELKDLAYNIEKFTGNTELSDKYAKAIDTHKNDADSRDLVRSFTSPESIIVDRIERVAKAPRAEQAEASGHSQAQTKVQDTAETQFDKTVSRKAYEICKDYGLSEAFGNDKGRVYITTRPVDAESGVYRAEIMRGWKPSVGFDFTVKQSGRRIDHRVSDRVYIGGEKVDLNSISGLHTKYPEQTEKVQAERKAWSEKPGEKTHLRGILEPLADIAAKEKSAYAKEHGIEARSICNPDITGRPHEITLPFNTADNSKISLKLSYEDDKGKIESLRCGEESFVGDEIRAVLASLLADDAGNEKLSEIIDGFVRTGNPAELLSGFKEITEKELSPELTKITNDIAGKNESPDNATTAGKSEKSKSIYEENFEKHKAYLDSIGTEKTLLTRRSDVFVNYHRMAEMYNAYKAGIEINGKAVTRTDVAESVLYFLNRSNIFETLISRVIGVLIDAFSQDKAEMPTDTPPEKGNEDQHDGETNGPEVPPESPNNDPYGGDKNGPDSPEDNPTDAADADIEKEQVYPTESGDSAFESSFGNGPMDKAEQQNPYDAEKGSDQQREDNKPESSAEREQPSMTENPQDDNRSEHVNPENAEDVKTEESAAEFEAPGDLTNIEHEHEPHEDNPDAAVESQPDALDDKTGPAPEEQPQQEADLVLPDASSEGAAASPDDAKTEWSELPPEDEADPVTVEEDANDADNNKKEPEPEEKDRLAELTGETDGEKEHDKDEKESDAVSSEDQLEGVEKSTADEILDLFDQYRELDPDSPEYSEAKDAILAEMGEAMDRVPDDKKLETAEAVIDGITDRVESENSGNDDIAEGSASEFVEAASQTLDNLGITEIVAIDTDRISAAYDNLLGKMDENGYPQDSLDSIYMSAYVSDASDTYTAATSFDDRAESYGEDATTEITAEAYPMDQDDTAASDFSESIISNPDAYAAEYTGPELSYYIDDIDKYTIELSATPVADDDTYAYIETGNLPDDKAEYDDYHHQDAVENNNQDNQDVPTNTTEMDSAGADVDVEAVEAVIF